MRALQSALTWIAIALLILVWVPLLGLIRLFDRDPARYRTGRWFRRLGAAVTYVNPAWRIREAGPRPAVTPRAPYVVVSNHLSNADIPLISRLPWEMKWVAKSGLFGVPVVGWMMQWAGDIPVDRRDAQSRASVLPRAAYYLRHRCSVMFFPEGTRSKTGEMLRWADGPFRLAIQEGVAVLPLAVDGTADALPKNDWKFGRAEQIRLRVLEPVPTAGLTEADAPELRERVKRAVAEQVAEWRGVPLADVLGAQPLLDAAPNASEVEEAAKLTGPLDARRQAG